MNIQTKMFLEREFRRAMDSAQTLYLDAAAMKEKAASFRKEADAQSMHAQELQKLLNFSGQVITVKLEVDSSEAEASIARTAAAIEKLAAQFDQLSVGGNALLTEKN